MWDPEMAAIWKSLKRELRERRIWNWIKRMEKKS